MAGLLKWRSSIPIYRRLYAKKTSEKTDRKYNLVNGRFKTIIDQLKKFTAFSFGTFIVVEIGELLTWLPGLITGYGHLKGFLNDYEEGGGNKATEQVRHFIKEGERRKFIGTGVGPGLAWLHYANYLRPVLAVDIESEMEKQGVFKELDSSRISKKLYTLIPRKCYVDLHADDNIEYVDAIEIDDEITVKLISVMDGETKYYCMCDCPSVLKTINHVNDIQMAGIARSKYTSLDLPWNRNSIIQLFTDNTKLVQLMRFYYALSSFLCIKINEKDPRDTARLLLFNESDKKPSEVLLRAIKEDLEVQGSEKKEDGLGKPYTNIEGCEEGTLNFANLLKLLKLLQHRETGNYDFESGNMVDWSEMPISADDDSQKTHSSLMEKKLLSQEENKDVLYNFDVFITHRRELTDKEKKEETDYLNDLKEMYTKLTAKNMKVLFEKDCLGKDWLTKLKYAATKCRWLVFIDTKTSNSTLFTSHKLTDSIHHILESKKVQTIAIVNPSDKVVILDDLNWVTCIPYKKNNFDILYNVLSGVDINMSKRMVYGDSCHKPGDVAIGLAWDYAANHLSKVLSVLSDVLKRAEEYNEQKLEYKPKLYIGIADSCKHVITENTFLKTDDSKEYTRVASNELPNNPTGVHMQVQDDKNPESKKKKSEMTFFAESPRPVDLIRQMRDDGLLTDEQMKAEVKIFCQTVDRITEILLPEKTKDYKFVHYDDIEKKQTFAGEAYRMHLNKMALLKMEHFAPILSSF